MSDQNSVRIPGRARRFGMLSLCWFAAMAISAVGFWMHQAVFPNLVQVLFENLLTGLVSLPSALVHLFTQPGDQPVRLIESKVLTVVLPYWVVLISCQIAYIRSARGFGFLVSMLLIVLSAPYWHYYARAWIGL